MGWYLGQYIDRCISLAFEALYSLPSHFCVREGDKSVCKLASKTTYLVARLMKLFGSMFIVSFFLTATAPRVDNLLLHSAHSCAMIHSVANMLIKYYPYFGSPYKNEALLCQTLSALH